MPACVFHDHHGPVFQVGDSLPLFLAFLKDMKPEHLARQYNGLQRICQLVDVQNPDSLNLGNLGKIVVISHYLGVQSQGQGYQFGIHVVDVVEILSVYPYLDQFFLLEAFYDIQAASATHAPGRVGAIRYMLQFLKHKLGNHEHAAQKTRFNDIGDAPVDYDARIEYFGIGTAPVRSLGKPWPARDAQFLDLNSAQYYAYVAENTG